MEVGSVWGHGSYVAPDWTADWLHREAVFILDAWAGGPGAYARLASEQQASLQDRLQQLLRANTYDPSARLITIDRVRAEAFSANLSHYADVFTRGRDEYAIPPGTLSDPEKLRSLAAFFWTSWAASTNRPNDDVSYTSNWPHEPLVGNGPTGDAVVWTGVSIILLLAGIGLMASYYASVREHAPLADAPVNDPLLGSAATASQRAIVKYFWTVAALILVQILLGVVTAHYGVEGSAFYGIPIATVLPYSIARTWHVQLGIFWIATAWLASGLYIGPAVSGVEPKWQRFGVNVLFVALLIVVVGSMAGQWLSVKQLLDIGPMWFYLGHSGYKYIDLGRLWQVLLLVGLFLWLGLMVRAIRPALREPSEQRPLLALFLIASVAIAGFYGAALGP